MFDPNPEPENDERPTIVSSGNDGNAVTTQTQDTSKFFGGRTRADRINSASANTMRTDTPKFFDQALNQNNFEHAQTSRPNNPGAKKLIIKIAGGILAVGALVGIVVAVMTFVDNNTNGGEEIVEINHEKLIEILDSNYFANTEDGLISIYQGEVDLRDMINKNEINEGVSKAKERLVAARDAIKSVKLENVSAKQKAAIEEINAAFETYMPQYENIISTYQDLYDAIIKDDAEKQAKFMNGDVKARNSFESLLNAYRNDEVLDDEYGKSGCETIQNASDYCQELYAKMDKKDDIMLDGELISDIMKAYNNRDDLDPQKLPGTKIAEFVALMEEENHEQ